MPPEFFSYLACAYSDPDPTVKLERERVYNEVDAMLSSAGFMIVSPMLKLPVCRAGKFPDDWAYWQTYSLRMIEMCLEVIVIVSEGWQKSIGLRGEIDHAESLGIPVRYYMPGLGFIDAPTIA